MTGQLPATLGYLAVLVVALLTPYANWGRASAGVGRWAGAAILACAVLLTAARHGAFQALSILLLLPLLGSGLAALLGGIAALLLFAPVIWWAPAAYLGPAAAVLFVLLALGACHLPRFAPATVAENPPLKLVAPMLIAFLIGIAVGLLTAPFGSWLAISFAWHHWSAYLAPVDAWLTGGVPYRDFPVQYGIGPTVLLRAACGSNCWSGIYWTTIVANALYFAVLAGCVLILTAGKQRGVRWLALGALSCATFVWTAFPADLGSVAMTPSVAGLRFLPSAALILHILSSESGRRRKDWLGHAIWLCSIFWSPESALFATLIWWPYLALRDAADAPTARGRWMALVRCALRGVLALVGAVAALALFIWWLSAGAARLGDFLAYILYPPGPLPIHPTGPVWLALAVILVALFGLVGTGRCRQGRELYACLLGFLGAGTYYLSRSDDNNILNLFPLMVVLLTACIPADPAVGSERAFAGAFVRTVLASMVAFVAFVGLTSWTDGARTDGLFNIGPSRLIARFTPQSGSQPQMVSTQVLRALAYLRQRNAGPVVLLNGNKVILGHAVGEGWTGVNNVANVESLPRALVTRYVCRGALVHRRPGWILVDEREYHSWLSVFEAGYVVREQVAFGPYRAYHLLPRSAPLSCADI